MRLGLGIHVRTMKLLQRVTRWRRLRARTPLVRRAIARVHIGSGPQILDGWFNVDLDPHPGVDLALDVRDGLPFRDVEHLFAEHFIEHLTFDEGLRFLKEARACLKDDGVLRMSTPNLEWVVRTQYVSVDAKVDACFALNKAFRGWGHRFLYNAATLEATLHAAGFARVDFQQYGVSNDPVLNGLERHERSPDLDDQPHVIVVEARGRREASLHEIESQLDDFDRAIHS